VKLGTKRLTAGIANLRAAVLDSNAAEWCSAVDIGGKEGFIKLEQARGACSL
jgi:hypothetical protein